jgi:hypothetical protein
MKKRVLKLMTMLAAGTCVCAMLVGCGNETETQTTSQTETQETQEVMSESTEAETPESSGDTAAEGGDTSDLVNSFIESEEETTEAEALAYDANGTAGAGTYIYDDYKADMDFSIVWTLTVNEDGSYTLSEDNPFIGVAEYAGKSSDFDGNRINCGEMDADKATTEGDWAYPTGFSVLVNTDDMTFQPENISDEVFGRDEDMDEAEITE